jgi:glycosyltransferase involved in cell wall biosynthesis
LPSTQPRVDPQQWLQPDAPVMLAVGRLNEGKRFDMLLRAFAQASAGQHGTQHWQLAILGDGPLHAALLELVNSLGLQGRVCLPGRVGNVGDWLARADTFAMTSRYEGYPNALLEALASGVPAVACDVLTGPRELIQHGVNGLLVSAPSPDALHEALTQALRQMMTNDAMRHQMAGQAHQTEHKHAIDSIVARWDAVFTQASAQSTGAQRRAA